MVNRGIFVLGMLTLSVLARALVGGHHPWDGPELFGITETNGVNLGDLLVLALWSVGAAYCMRLWRRERQ